MFSLDIGLPHVFTVIVQWNFLCWISRKRVLYAGGQERIVYARSAIVGVCEHGHKGIWAYGHRGPLADGHTGTCKWVNGRMSIWVCGHMCAWAERNTGSCAWYVESHIFIFIYKY